MEKKESFDEKVKTSDDTMRTLFGGAGFGKQYDAARGFLDLIVKFFANYSICIFHINMGSRSLSLMWIISGYGFFKIIDSFASFQWKLSMFLGPGMDVSFYKLHGLIFLTAGLIQLGWMKYRDLVLKQECYSYSLGSSLLFPLWNKLMIKIKSPILHSEFEFQMYIESGLVIGFGMFLSKNLGLEYGGFLMFVGACQFGLYNTMKKNFMERLYDMVDSKIVNQEFVYALEQKKGEEGKNSSSRGFNMLRNHVMLNQVQRVLDKDAEIDPELKQLQQDQLL